VLTRATGPHSPTSAPRPGWRDVAELQCGRAFEFIRTSRTWREGARLVDALCRSYDQYGYSVAISGRNAIIGAPGADNNAGAVYVVTLP
jgi:hypothetical protein